MQDDEGDIRIVPPQPKTSRYQPQGLFLTILLTGGCANGFIPGAVKAWSLGGGWSAARAMFGISPFEIVIAAIAAEALVSSGLAARGAFCGFALPAAAFAAAVLMPIGMLSWGMTLVFSLWAGARCMGPARRGALLCAGLSACALWWSFGERTVGGTILSFDAAAAAGVLSMIIDGVHRSNNVITMPGGHGVVVLITCSTAYGVPLSLLSMIALATRGGQFVARNVIFSAIGLAAAYAAVNVARICILAWSPLTYHAGHSEIGLSIFDVTVIMLTLGTASLTRMATKHGSGAI